MIRVKATSMRSPHFIGGSALVLAAAAASGCPDFVAGTPSSGGGGDGGTSHSAGGAAGPSTGGGGQGGGEGGGVTPPSFDGPPLLSTGRGDYDHFGVAVALSETSGTPTLIAGADSEDASGDGSGAAYVFVRGTGGWTEQQKLEPDDAAENYLFGGSVALDGDTALVGAAGAEAAYVFVRSGSTWTQQAKLTSSDANAWALGGSVALAGDVALVGDHLGFVPATGQVGAVHTFVRTGTVWVEEGRVMDSEPTDDDGFGRAIDFDGSTLVVGAPFDDQGSVDAGSVLVFERLVGQWSAPQRLLADDAVNDDQFGYDVAVDGDTIVVGAHRHDVAADKSGAAYVFVRDGNTWRQQAMLSASDGGQWHYFGGAVDVRGERALVGAAGVDGVTDLNLGAAYAYGRSSRDWTEQLTLVPEGPTEEHFGDSVSFGDTYAAIGAPRGRGKVYIWRVE